LRPIYSDLPHLAIHESELGGSCKLLRLADWFTRREMRLRQFSIVSAIVFVSLFFFSVLVASSQQSRSKRGSSTPSLSGSRGQHIFASNCVGCHGLDGTGSQRAPNIVSNPQVQKLSAEEMFRIVSDGVPGTGMPSFKSLGPPAIRSTVAYVRSLQGKNASARLPGDPKRGEAIFFGAAECGNCHMAGGRGGFIAPDLSTYGQTHSAEAIKTAITTPAARDHVQSLVTAVTAAGERYEGIVRNEDNFSLQLQSADGGFHFLSKAELKSFERSQTLLMPSDYGTKLNAEQLNDVASFLLKLAQSSTPPSIHHPEEE
jgi:cytochrome c oxidase cbb3-type subunit 3